jgi:hypothetical protein
MRALASGIAHALTSLNGGKQLEFVLVVVTPDGAGEVTLNTITGITDPREIAQIGRHLIDMAVAQSGDADLDEGSEVSGHA